MFLDWLFPARAYAQILSRLGVLMTTSAELATAINEQTALIEKIGTETTATLAKVAELQAAIDAGAVTPEVQAAFDALKVQVGKVDDLVKDSPSPAV